MKILSPQPAPQDMRERAISIAQWAVDNRYPKSELDKVGDFEYFQKIGNSIIDLIEQFVSEVSAEKDREIESLKAKLVIAAAERDGITHNLLNVQQDCIEATKRIAELEKDVEFYKSRFIP